MPSQTPNERIAVVGLGYVGLPVAMAFARRFPGTIGFDVDADKVAGLEQGRDRTGSVSGDALRSAGVDFTSDPSKLGEATFFVVAVPTPVDANRRPDLRHLQSASELVGRALRPGAVVVFESTVYPGVTEEICGPILERASGLSQGTGFSLGYSPERINPGDDEHTLERIVKVVAGQDDATLERVAQVYESIVEAGVHRAPSIKVAEAAKVIENTQRDLNIALMNELALIFDRLGIRSTDVLAAAGTKWNFLPFTPGLVGGHCIGVDPYYLTNKAEEVGYHPQVILAGRRINDGIGAFVAQKVIKLLSRCDAPPMHRARVGILGATFKENVADLRNSRVPDIVREFLEFGIDALLYDPLVEPAEVEREYGLQTCSWSDLRSLDALVLAVPHRGLAQRVCDELPDLLKPHGVFADVKSVMRPSDFPAGITYWSL